MATKTIAKKKTTKTAAPVERAVLVTTQHRGVFFGYTTATGAPDTVELVRARLVVYWPAAQKGFLGLAANGPVQGSRIGPQAPSIALRYVTSVSDLTPEATARFEAAPWA
jgi:hypothetical protein